MEQIAEEDGTVIFAQHLIPPTRFLGERLYVDANYMFEFPEKDEYMMIVSSDGNERFLQDYLNSNVEECKDITVAYCHISAHYLKPIYAEE